MIEEKYYTWEYDYLQRAGEEFAEKHENIARFLNLTERYQKDPFVERLCEAFAFLTGTIHSRLDDDFPELTGALLEHIFPQLLRPFPACSVLQIDIPSRQITKPVSVKRGEEVHGAWKEGGRQYQAVFQTAQPVTVLPLTMGEPRISEDRKSMKIPFLFRPNVKVQDLVFDPIRLFINATETKHYALLYHLVDAAKEIRVSIGDDEAVIQKNARFEIPALQDVQEMDSLLKVRDEDDEEFLNGQFGGHRLLLEYFSFVQRFFYVDLVGLDASRWPEDMTEFTIHVSFKDAFDTAYQLTDKDLLFNTVPIINLFSGKSHVQPLTLDGKHAEYEVRPFPEYKDITEIYAVNGLKSTTGTTYVASTAFEILSSPAAYPEPQGHRRDSEASDQTVFYTTSTKRVADQLSKTFVQLIQDDEELEHVVLDRVNVQTLVTNGNFPSIRLGEGTITGTRSTEWAGLRVSNIIRPTKVKECALRKDYLWAFIAHLTTNLRTIAEGNTLRQLLSLYNWNPNSEDSSHRKIRDGLVRMHPPEYKTRYQNGGFMRVLEVAIDVDLGQFEFGEGDLYLFGAVLNRFLSEYATLNTHVSLKLNDVSDRPARKKEYTWEPTTGNIALI